MKVAVTLQRALLPECAESSAAAGRKVRSGLQREDAKQNESPRRYMCSLLSVLAAAKVSIGVGVSAGQRDARLAGSEQCWSKIKARTIWWEDWPAFWFLFFFLIIFAAVLKWTERKIAFVENDTSSGSATHCEGHC